MYSCNLLKFDTKSNEINTTILTTLVYAAILADWNSILTQQKKFTTKSVIESTMKSNTKFN